MSDANFFVFCDEMFESFSECKLKSGYGWRATDEAVEDVVSSVRDGACEPVSVEALPSFASALSRENKSSLPASTRAADGPSHA